MKMILERAIRRHLQVHEVPPGLMSLVYSRPIFLRLAFYLWGLSPRWVRVKLWPFNQVSLFMIVNGSLMAGHEESKGAGRKVNYAKRNTSTKYDVVVIGSGPGGSVAALRHIEAGRSVLIIEEGGYFESESISHHSRDQADSQLRARGFEAIYGKPPVAFAQGMTVGGGSEVNSGLYHRLPGQYRSEILAKVGVSESVWTDLEHLVENQIHVSHMPEGRRDDFSDFVKDFATGSEARGYVVEEVPRWRKYSPERHQGMVRTYIDQALKLGADILPETRVHRVRDEGDAGVTIECGGRDKPISITAREVIVACGSLETLGLLARSRLISPGRYSFGFHPMVRVLARHNREINDGELFPPYQSWDESYKVKFGFSVSQYDYLAAQYAATTGERIDAREVRKLASYFASFTLQDSSALAFVTGRFVIPTVSWGQSDKRFALEAEHALSQLLSEGGAVPIERKLRQMAVSTVHVFGGMRYGGNRALISQTGKLESSQNVFVSDASCLPASPWVNPQGPIMVLCELLARRKLGGLR